MPPLVSTLGNPANYGVGTSSGTFDFVPHDDGAFNYNEKILVETSQKGVRDFYIYPFGGPRQQAGPYNFYLEPQVDRYYHLNKTQLEVRCHVERADGTLLSTWEDVVAPVTLLGACMWENIEVYLNGHPFSGSSSINSGYKAYMETMLSYDTDARNTHLHTQLLHLDTPGQYENEALHENVIREGLFEALEAGVDKMPTPVKFKWRVGQQNVNDLRQEEIERRQSLTPPGEPLPADWIPPAYSEAFKYKQRRAAYQAFWDTLKMGEIGQLIVANTQQVNTGFGARFQLIKGSKSFDMTSPIHHDFFKLNNHIGPGNKIDIKLTPYKSEFLLNAFLGYVYNYKLVIDDIRLHLRTIERRERIAIPGREIYQMNETQVKKQLVQTNAPSATFRIHNGGVMPKNVTLGMVSVAAAEGSYRWNPFNFHHYFVNGINLIINGERYPSQPLDPNFSLPNARCSRLFKWVFENTGAGSSGRGNIISWPAFQAGCTLVPFDLNYDLCNGAHNHNADYGFIDVEIKFAVPLTEPIYVIYEMVFPKVVVNDKVAGSLAIIDVAV